MENELAQMRLEIEHLQADRVAMVIMLTALMQTHHNHDQMQLHLTRLLEMQLSGGALGNTLTPAQNERVRELVEWLQVIKKA